MLLMIKRKNPKQKSNIHANQYCKENALKAQIFCQQRVKARIRYFS